MIVCWSTGNHKSVYGFLDPGQAARHIHSMGNQTPPKPSPLRKKTASGVECHGSDDISTLIWKILVCKGRGSRWYRLDTKKQD